MNKILFLAGLLFMSMVGMINAQETNVLFVGNSFTVRHDLPSLVKKVFEEGEPGLTMNYEMVTYGGQDLFRHHDLYFSQSKLRLNSITIPEIEEMITQIRSFQAMETAPEFFTDYYEETGLRPTEWDNNNVVSGLSRSLSNQEKLIERIQNNQRVKWDYVVLQSWRDVVDDVDKGYAKYAQKFARIAEEEGVKVILYVTAPDAQNATAVEGPVGLDQSEMEMETIHDLVDRINPYAVVPVAEGLKMIQKDGTDLTFRYINDMHPNQYTAFLTANMFYAAVFKKSTEGFSFNTVTETKLDEFGKDPDGGNATVVFDEDTKLSLQRTAYEAVRDFSSQHQNLIFSSLLPLEVYGVWDRDADPEFDPSDPKYSYLRGVSSRPKWSEIQSNNSSEFDWSIMQEAIDLADARDQLITLKINVGPEAPDWIYDHGVTKVTTTGHRFTDFPYYLEQDYIYYYYTLIDSFASFVHSQPEHKQDRIAFIFPQTGATGDEVPYKGDLTDLTYDISTEQWRTFRINAWEHFRQVFRMGPERPIPFLFNDVEPYSAEWTWIINNIGDEFGFKASNGYVRGHHLTDEKVWIEKWKRYLIDPQDLALFNRAEMDQTWRDPLYQINVDLGFYWGAISGLNTGLSVWDITGNALEEAGKNASIQETFQFFTKYAGQIYPEFSTKAFIALHEGLNSADTEKFPESKYGTASKSNESRYAAICKDPLYAARGAKMEDLYAATMGQVYQRSNQTGYNDAGWEIWPTNYSRFITQISPESTSIGLFRVGGPIHEHSPIYSRFARSFEHKSARDTMYFQVHEDMFDGTADTVTFIVRYLDKENGSTWRFAYDAGEAELKTAYSITCNGSGTWKTQTVTVPDAVLNRNGPRGADFALINTDAKDDIFHMIEVEKGVAGPVVVKKNDAFLRSIAWPDIPDSIYASYNWTSKEVPGFDSETFTYEIQLPQEYMQVPALLAQAEDINAAISTERASNLYGTKADRTTTFVVTAEDGKTQQSYSVTFNLQGVAAVDNQPFLAEPLFTRLVYREWFNNNYIEISNPGSDSLDLSHYLVAIGVSSTPGEIIADTLPFEMRYNYYIPGRDYPTDDTLLYVPGIVTDDPEVNPVIEPDGSFVIGHIENTNLEENTHVNDCDIIINRDLSFDTEVKLIVPGFNTIMKNGWFTGALCLYKILNDSIRNGTKAISDPADFQLIDVFGTYDGSDWAPDGAPLLDEDNQWNITRKADFWKGDTLPGLDGSWGPTKEESEWICFSRDDYLDMGMSYPSSENSLTEGIGVHAFSPVLEYRSTISSQTYSVSAGYESPQYISEIPFNTTFATFLANITKSHEDQLIVLTAPDGAIKANEDIIIEGDTLTVTSEDGSNTTKYGLQVGMSDKNSDAILLAADGSGYVITHSDSNGVISRITPGNTIAQVIENIIIPEKARLEIIDYQNNLVPLQTMTFDGSYTNTVACGEFTFKVTAEDNYTTTDYRLEFLINEDEAYAWSYMYLVDHEKCFVSEIPEGVNTGTLFRYLFPNIGSGIELIDRAGLERLAGPVDFEDIIIVTSANGSVEKKYQLNFTGEILGTDAYITSETYIINQENFMIDSILLDTPIDEFFNNITIAPYASTAILDDSVPPSPNTTLDGRHSLAVTSGDGETTNIYHFSFYEIIQGTEAYILSDTFIIRQETLVIDSLMYGTPVDVFLAHVSAAPGAIIAILDADQNPVTIGILEQDYTIRVSSEDGLKEVIYTIHFYDPDLVPETASLRIRIYPNPSKNQFTLEGLVPQSTIIITNIYGRAKCVLNNKNSGKIEVSISDLDPGIYFVEVLNKNDINHTLKLIIE